jgi:hypothetical protein
MTPEQAGSGSPFAVGKNYSDTAPGTEAAARPPDTEGESAAGGVMTISGDQHESGQNETAGDAETGQPFPT